MSALVVTTINGSDNKCLQILSAACAERKKPFIVAGDTKTPGNLATLAGCTYLSIEEQEKRYPAMCALLPKKHYGRKNIAYLTAIADGAQEIQETDDDNFPRGESFWKQTTGEAITVDVAEGKPWANVYALFSKQRIWPRGLPLEYVHHSVPVVKGSRTIEKPLILQGLADENPDVDAVFRMTFDLPVSFEKRGPVMMEAGSWCPFNSQNTIHHREVFPLLYLPSFCSFRMTDIWRSFVAQRCVWELGQGIIFHESTVYQERNEHRLLKDFEDEVPGYLLNDKIRLALEKTGVDGKDLGRSVVLCYEKMVEGGFIDGKELPLVKSWCEMVQQVMKKH